VSEQYLRQISLVVANQAGQGYELGQLRCVFEVRRGDLQTPNTCDVKVYNLSADTANALSKPEFTQLSLQVGYGSPSALKSIFRGSIKQVRLGREDQKNSYVAITAADSDQAYNYAAMAETLAAGSSQEDSVALFIQGLARAASCTPEGGAGGQPTTEGFVTPLLNPAPRIRGRVLFGLCVDEARDFADINDCKFSMQDGQFTLIPKTGYIPNAPILITPFTGLIGVPETTQNGLELTVLLNPSIKIGSTIKLDYSTVNQLRYGTDINSVQLNQYLHDNVLKPNPSGLYYCMWAEHSGNTRGQPWYTKLVCLAVDASVPVSVGSRGTPQPQDSVPRF
jgi:hypothetical protein